MSLGNNLARLSFATQLTRNAEIADWLVRLTANCKTGDFDLFLHLHNVTGYD
jgi:hypothetical protein